MDEIVLERREDVAVVRLNRGNSVTPAVVTEPGDAVQWVCADDSRADGSDALTAYEQTSTRSRGVRRATASWT